MQTMLKVGDLSHPTRSLDVHLNWSDRVTEEFFQQGELS